MTPPAPEARPPNPDWFERRPLVVLALLTVAFYWKLTLTTQFTHLESPDLAYQVLPWYQFQARSMQAGVFPLWDPWQWAGQSLLGQMQPGAAFPLNWPLFLAPLKEGYLDFRWVHWHFVGMHLLAAAFMYACCRQLGSSRYASVVAGAAFSFSGYLGTTVWPQMLHGAMWIPLVFLFFHRMAERGGLANAAGCGAAIGLSLLSGHHQAPMFTLAALGGVLLYHLCTRPERRRLLGLAAVAAVFAFLVGALQLLPALEYGSHAYRWVEGAPPIKMQETVPYLAQYNLGVYPLSLLGVLFPKAYLTTDPFLGLVGLSFAVFAAAAGWKLGRVRLYGVLALGAVAYAAGHYSLLHGLAYSLVPFLDKARSPGHAIFVFQFAVLILTAQGIDLWFGSQQEGWQRWRSRIQRALVAIGLLAWAQLFWLYLNLKFEVNPGDHVILSSLVAFLLAAVLHGIHRGHLTARQARVSVALLALFEMSITSYFFFSHRDDPKRAQYLKKLAEHRDLVTFLKAQPRPFRFDVESQVDFPANLGDWEGLESTRGYLASISDRLYDFVGWDWGRATLALNTVYVVAKQPTRPQQRQVWAGAGEWKVFRNEDAFPRAWVAEAVRRAPDRRAAGELFRSREFDPRRETFVLAGDPAPQVESCGEGVVQVSWHGLHRIAAWSATACASMVVFAEPYFPGWRARVDGREVPLYAPFGALRGVVVPAGSHQIELLYRPRAVYLGAALSALGLAAWAMLAGRAALASR